MNARTPDLPIEPLFLDRWSPRAYDAGAMPEADLLTILEAARWAPSAYNVQPWRFVYARRDDADWQTFLGILDPFNRAWAASASALMLLVSDTIMPGDGHRPDQPSRMHSFDAGAAWAQLALQATSLGYQAHAMAGIHHDMPHELLNVPERFKVEIAIAVGRRRDPAELPKGLREQERPSGRMPLDEIAFAGRFPETVGTPAAA